MDDGIKLYLKQHGDKLGGKKSNSSARTSAALRRRSPSAWRRNW
jgi:hypothetical protein